MNCQCNNRESVRIPRHRVHFLSLVIITLLFVSGASLAADSFSITWDNDLFLGEGEDDGYTNGINASWYDTGRKARTSPQPSFLVRLLLWSLSDEPAVLAVNSHTIGQLMITPEDISAENPDPNDIPYAGLLFYSNHHLRIYESYVDTIGTTLGIVGPASGAEETQKFVHDLIGGDEPRGWDYQLKNELVFQFARNRLWRAWAKDSGKGNMDMLISNEFRLGTLESSLGGSVTFRFGTGMSNSFATSALRGSRVVNPLAVAGGWNIYIGIQGRYIGNMIFTDGNTYRDSRSVKLDPTQVGILAGFSYSWGSASLTMAMEDMSFFEKQYESMARFGTLTFAWQLQD